jgi:hypothetical protein
MVEEPSGSVNNSINERIMKAFKGSPLSTKEILEKAGLDWTIIKLKAHLQKMEEIQKVEKGNKTMYALKGNQVQQGSLFE